MHEPYQSPPPELTAQLARSRLHQETSGREGAAIYLAFEDHEGLDLAGAVLAEGTLQEANLARCRLDGASFYRALANGIRLEGASLAGADFTRAEMEAANLRGASGPRAVFVKTTLNRARLDGGAFPDADFRQADCIDAGFADSRLDGANFSGALLDGSDFSGASLAGADFSGAVLSTTTRFHRCRGLEQVVVSRVHVGARELEGEAAREALAELGRGE